MEAVAAFTSQIVFYLFTTRLPLKVSVLRVFFWCNTLLYYLVKDQLRQQKCKIITFNLHFLRVKYQFSAIAVALFFFCVAGHISHMLLFVNIVTGPCLHLLELAEAKKLLSLVAGPASLGFQGVNAEAKIGRQTSSPGRLDGEVALNAACYRAGD